MDKTARSAIEYATQRARELLDKDFSSQLEGTFDVLRSGVIANGGAHLSAGQRFQRDKIVAAVEHKCAVGMSVTEAITDYVRDAAFTTLNRFVALKMLEARELVQECITKGEQSSGYREFCGLAPGLFLLPESAGYRLYIESIFDELSTEMKVLFDRRDCLSVLWPKRATFEQLLTVLNDADLVSVWREDETVGWVYQYFNSLEERQAMKDVKSGGSQAPRNSRELATRNQFFTPRYIVEFLADNTLGRLWCEMRGEDTELRERCHYLAVKPGTILPPRLKKDPRDLRVIDPACGSAHFLLYVFDLLLEIYEEGWADLQAPRSSITGRSLREDYPTKEALRSYLPELILRHNLYGVDIDPRCLQVASFALWMRAQRAWSEFAVPHAGRHRIERSNLILAEAMPGNANMVRAFATEVKPPVIGELFEKIVAAFRLAGDLGLMLRVERVLEEAIEEAEVKSRQGDLFVAGATPHSFWKTAESRLLSELARFASEGSGSEQERRRLFREDAAHGLALLDAARAKFDVVLMNPPFGDPSGPSKDYLERAYPQSRQDIFAVFVDRCVRELAPNGFVGVISTEAGFFRRTLEPWRRNVLLASSNVEVFAHLGDNVLDTARVRVAAYVLSTPHNSHEKSSIYIRAHALDRASRQPALDEAVNAVRADGLSSRVFQTDQREFEKLPYAVFGYWCAPRLRDAFVKNPPLEGTAGRARQGLATADDFRFLRLRWEVDPSQVNSEKWIPFAKGGEYSPFHDDVHLLLDWQDVGRELIAWGKGRPQNTELFGKPGLTWPLRTTSRFAPRTLPRGCAFGHKGPAIVGSVPNAWALLAALNSSVTAYLLSFGTGAIEAMDASNSYEVGLIQRLPIPAALLADAELADRGKTAWASRADASLRDETAAIFLSPVAPLAMRDTLTETWRDLVLHEERNLTEYVSAQEAIDRRTCAVFGLNDEDWAEIKENVGDVHRPLVPSDDRARRTWVERYVSFLVGCAFGRWSSARLTSSIPIAIDLAFAEPKVHFDELPAEPGVLVEDAGHPLDIAFRCEIALERAVGPRANKVIEEANEILGSAELRQYLNTSFFDAHLKDYTKSRRSSPIYLPLSSGRGEYTIWLYIHRIESDTLYKIQSEILGPKLRLEEGRLEAFQGEGQPGPKFRRQLASQQVLVDSLSTMFNEIKRVAPLWKLNLDDGVVVCFAPL